MDWGQVMCWFTQVFQKSNIPTRPPGWYLSGNLCKSKAVKKLRLSVVIVVVLVVWGWPDITSCARATQYTARCMADAAAHPYACGAQCALLPIAVGSMDINELMNINDVRESALKVVSESRVPILVFLSLSVLELFSMYATDVRRQTASSLNAPTY